MPDQGRVHETNPNASLTYGYCPPASGPHYNKPPQGPLPRAFYGPDQEKRPGGWVHNLEHGFMVVAYSCKDGCPPAQELDAVRQWWESQPSTPGAQACQIPNKILVVRFDQMATKYALLGWDRVQLLPAWDAQSATDFATQWIDSPQTPELRSCF